MAKLVRHDETALTTSIWQVPSPRKEGKQMRPPGRLEKESERALLKTANKRTEQYVNEKHSVLTNGKTKAFSSMNTHMLDMGLAALSYFGCFSTHRLHVHVSHFESPALLLRVGVNPRFVF